MSTDNIVESPCAVCGTSIKITDYRSQHFFCDNRCSYGCYSKSGSYWLRVLTKDDFIIEFYSGEIPIRIGPRVNFFNVSKPLEIEINPLDAKDWIHKLPKLYRKMDDLKAFL